MTWCGRGCRGVAWCGRGCHGVTWCVFLCVVTAALLDKLSIIGTFRGPLPAVDR